MAQWKTDVEACCARRRTLCAACSSTVAWCTVHGACRYGFLLRAVRCCNRKHPHSSTHGTPQDLASGLMDDKWATSDGRHSHEDDVLALLVQAEPHTGWVTEWARMRQR